MNTAARWNEHDWAGRVVDGRFTLLQWLGGSLGQTDVFLTELQGESSQKAVIKLIPADGVDAQARIARWAATRSLIHPHLLRVFETGRCQIDTDPLLYAVTEYAEEDLSQIIPERPLTPAEAKEMLGPVLDALAYLHRKGFVHSRLKPSNILVVEDQLKLSCDGISVAGDGGSFSAPLTVYDAPEVGIGMTSPAADLWSLGVTLVEALSQHAPVWDRVAHRDAVVPESIPQPFAQIARECLRFDAGRRATIAEVRAHLEPARRVPDATRSVVEPARPASLPAFQQEKKRRGKSLGIGLVAVMLVLFAVIAGLNLRSHHSRSSLPVEKPEPVAANAALPPQVAASGKDISNSGTVRGAVAERVLPNVSQFASRTIRGKVKVTVRVTVDASGNVSNAKFDSAGGSKYFANLALDAAQKWKFTPARVNGQAASSVWILPFQFRQTATEVTPVEVSP